MFGQGTQLNISSYKTPEQLEYEQSIKDAMMAEALRTNQPTNQQGMMQASAPPVQASAPNSYADTSKWSDANWATALEGNLPTLNSGFYSNLTPEQTNNILKKDPNFFVNLLKEGDSAFTQTENDNRSSLTNYSGPAFTSTDDVYSYMDGLNIDDNLDAFGGRTGKIGGNGGLMSGGSSLKGSNTDTHAAQHDFVNTHYTQLGKMPIYQDGDDIYVLNTGFGDNRPDLGEDELGNKLKFDGHGGYYHKSGGAEKGEYQRYVKQDKQGPDTDAFFDQVMPVVMAVAQATFIGAAAAPAGAAIGGTTAGATAGTVVPTLGANLVTGALTGAGTTALSQATSGQGFDLTDIAIGGLKGGVSGAATGMISDYAAYAGGGFETGAIEGAGNAFVSGALEGEFDLENIAIGGLVGGGIQALKDGWDDLFQTDDLRDLTKQELGKPEWNSLDLTDAQLAELSPAQLHDYGLKEIEFTDHVKGLYRTTDLGKLFGEEGLLNKMGFDTEYISTAPIVNALEFIATPLNALSELMGGEAFYAPSAAGDKWDEDFTATWHAKKKELYEILNELETMPMGYGRDADGNVTSNPAGGPERLAAIAKAKDQINMIDAHLGYQGGGDNYGNSDFNLVGLAQSGASNEDLDFFRNVNYIDPDNPDHYGNTEAQNWVNEDLAKFDAGLITEEDVLTSLNNAADYNYQQNVRYDERFSAWAPRDDSLPWTHIQETDSYTGSRPGRIDTLKDKVAAIPAEAAEYIDDVHGMLTAGPEAWSDAINIVTDAYDAWESGASALSEGTDFGNYIEQNLQASNTPNELYANLGVDSELTEGSVDDEDVLPIGDVGGEDVLPPASNPEEILPPASNPEEVLPPGSNPEEVLPPGSNPEEVFPPGSNPEEVLPPGEDPTLQQKAIQDDYMIDKELYRLARITQVISLSEGDLASIQKRMAVLREQKEAIAGDIVGAVQKKSGKYIKQTYEEEGQRKRTREDNIVENPELYTT